MIKSKILKKDQDALIKLSKAMTPEERLMAFYHHSQLLHRLAQSNKKRKVLAKNSRASHLNRPSAS